MITFVLQEHILEKTFNRQVLEAEQIAQKEVIDQQEVYSQLIDLLDYTIQAKD